MGDPIPGRHNEIPGQSIVTVTVPRADERYIDRATPEALNISLERPIGQKRLQRMGEEQTFQILADFAFDPPPTGARGKGAQDVRFCIVEEPPRRHTPDTKFISLFTYTHDTDGRDVFLELHHLEEGLGIRSGFYTEPLNTNLIQVTRHGTRFSVEQLTKEGELKATIPEQSRREEDIEREATVSRFPAEIPVKTLFHRGSYDVADPETFDRKLADDVRETWVELAEGLGLEPSHLPRVSIDFWAPVRDRIDTKGISIRRRFRNVTHILNPKRPETPTSHAQKRRVALSLEKDGSVDKAVLTRELFALYANDQGIITTTKDPLARISNEGFSGITDFLLGDIPENRSTFGGFNVLTTSSLEGHPRTSGSPETDLANHVLHFYLWKERGGESKARALANFLNERGGSQLLRGYETVYEEPLYALTRKAEAWQRRQRED
ncbi:MAG: hypothetical protein AAB553_04590 [Patescibacteria group bacterium]